MTTRRTITALAASFALLAMGAALAGAGEAADEARKLETYRASARLFDSAAAAARRGDTEAAMRGYASAIEADPSFVEAMVNLARLGIDAAEGDEDLAAARHWLDRAEQVRPDYPKIAATRALLAVREGDTAAALEAIDHAHRLAPDDVEIAVNYGALLIQR